MLFNSVVVLALLQLAAAQSKPVSKNARCGQAFGGQTCQGSKWGNCCSQYNYCGSTKDYCDVANKCQKDFGTCNGQPGQSPVSSRTTLSTSVRGASSVPAPSPSASNGQGPPGTCSAVTVTKSGDVQVITQIATLPATTITLPAVTETLAGSIVTLPAVTETLPAVTETLPAVTETLPAVTETLPAVTETLPAVTETLPAVTETLPAVTETLPAVTETLPAVTETLPAVTETLPAVTETLPAVTETLPALTETLPAVTETLPAVTETLPAVTETLPAVTETLPAVTETLPAVTETLPAITLPASTVTQTASASCAATCPTGNPVVNGNFEATLSGSWSPLVAGDATIERVSVGGANANALRARINSGNQNQPQRIIQAIIVCPGVNYRVSFEARRVTSAGTVSAILYINDTPLAGGTITSTTFQAVSLINSGIFSTTSNSVSLRIEFAYAQNLGVQKEVQVDNIVLTRL